MTDYATKEELRLLRQSTAATVKLAGATLRKLASGKNPTIEEVHGLFGSIAPEVIDPEILAVWKREGSAIIA